MPDSPPAGSSPPQDPPLAIRIRRVLGRREIGLLLLLATLAAGAWIFLEIADEVNSGDIVTVDERILMLFREGNNPNDPIGSHSVESAVRDVTALGSLTVISLLTLITVAFLFLSRRPRLALYMFVASAGGAALSYALKFLYNRPRPNLVAPEALPSDPSFPSGHSAAAAVVYLTLGLLLAHTLARRELKVYVVTLAILLTVAVGLSRLYLGVHWPSDVLAGWTLGGVWALACWQAERMLRQRGLVEEEAHPEPEDARVTA
ncbi:MAG: phosphatase PAP2 family protein [Rhodothermaceae bacterium]|nr:phosphatase PAP2 family protein [Rhodothermaceae bacterium]